MSGCSASGIIDTSVQGVLLRDVTPLSLGVEVNQEVFSVVILQNTPIPTSKARPYYTTYDNQSAIKIKVYQGERSRSTDNHLLGKFGIYGIPPTPKGVSKVMVCFEIDANGFLTVSASITSTGKMEKLIISSENGRLSKEEIEKMVNDAEKYKLEDLEFKKKVDAYNELEDCICNMKKKIKEQNVRKRVHHEILQVMKSVIEETSNWLKNNQAASFTELQLQKAHLEKVCKPLF
ncbi:putative Heat shock protein 70 family [Helianthus anomalus]